MKPFWTIVWMLQCLFLMPSVQAIMQTAQLDVYLPSSSSSTDGEPSYTLLVSQASFGSYPSMEGEGKKRLVLPPQDNPLLCENITSVAAPTETIMLVPRGNCTFELKALNAQRLGAGAILVYGTLESRYSLNETNQTDYEYTEKDIIYPSKYYDYDCSYGRAEIEESVIQLEPLPYNAEHNDPLLSGNTSQNLCLSSAPDKLESCPSKACLLTGVRGDDNRYEACCAWDLHIWLYADTNFNGTEVTIPAAYVTMEQGNRLRSDLQRYSNIDIVLSARWRSSYNISSYLIWMLGVFVAGLASYLSASDYHKLIHKAKRQQERAGQPRERRGGDRPRTTPPPPPHDESMELTAGHALVFIIMASTSLLVLFYLKIYNVVKILYAFGCSKAVSQIVLDPLFKVVMKKVGVKNRIVWRTGSEDFGDLSLRDILSHVVGYSLGLAWLIVAFTVRHPEGNAYFWVMQDIFGASMCILFLQVIKLNSLRVASILLTVAFFYDIFFVFVTPLLFKGKSVMIEVATSGGPPTADPLWCEKYPADKNCQGGDPLPMLFTIPRINDYQGGSSLLGLGDIVLPGLLLSFAARFDAAKSLLGVLGGGNGALNSNACPERKLCGDCRLCSGGYLPPMIVAYAIGLFMANAAVYLMHMGQPALLYLVPCCLGTIVYMGWRRGELQDLWDDPKSIRAADAILYGETTSASHAPLPVDEGVDSPAVPSAMDDNPGDMPLLEEQHGEE